MEGRNLRERKSKIEKLAEYKRTREGGRRTYKLEEDAAIYDEVTEEQYKSIVRGRLAKDDFVVDDGVGGYMDNGMDDFDEREQAGMSDEEDVKPKPIKKDTKAKAKAKPRPLPPAVTPSISAYRPTVSAAQETDFMASLLGDMDTIDMKPKFSKKRKPEPEPDHEDPFSTSDAPSRPTKYGYRSSYAEGDMSSDGFLDTGMPSGPSSDDDFAVLSPKKKLKTEDAGMTPAIHRLGINRMDGNSSAGESMADTSFDDMDMDAFMDVDEDFTDEKPMLTAKKEPDVKARPLKPMNGALNAEDKKKSLDSIPTWLSVYDSLTVSSEDKLGPTAGSSKTSANPSSISILEDDGSLRFFWLDYLEHEGRLYFVGKAQDKTSKAWLSCCVTVENLQRNLFVLPRERRVEEDEETGELVDTDVVPSLTDVYADFDRVRKKVGIKSFKGKFVNRRYAFGEKDIPRGESQWLKVVYGFDGGRTNLNLPQRLI
ncbi:hypothetical protein PHLCEN_2v1679 [Hermanssonia centrifuga]|uniref:DNA polymerase alpha catalytic subunit N-terminal domain-containing protein n=1 Tax=Hermanssonia centrifuga TaxID=98765 RepID=A0A2R6RZ79_9APHY|nr:hypothetical protein PHLCEN_2v1679 [Hermanssonia centrifuga]